MKFNRNTRLRENLRAVVRYAEIVYMLTYLEAMKRFNDQMKASIYAHEVVHKIEQIETRKYNLNEEV